MKRPSRPEAARRRRPRRRSAPRSPRRRRSAKFSAGKALASSLARRALAERRHQRLDGLEPRCLRGLAGLHHAVLLLRRSGQPEGQQVDQPVARRARHQAGRRVDVLGHAAARRRGRGTRAPCRRRRPPSRRAPGSPAGLDRARCAARRRRRARPRARQPPGREARRSARGRPSAACAPRAAPATASSKPVSTSSTPKRPRASAVATGQARLYCISSVVRGPPPREVLGGGERAHLDRRDPRRGSRPSARSRSAASMPGCDQRQHGYGLRYSSSTLPALAELEVVRRLHELAVEAGEAARRQHRAARAHERAPAGGVLRHRRVVDGARHQRDRRVVLGDADGVAQLVVAEPEQPPDARRRRRARPTTPTRGTGPRARGSARRRAARPRSRPAPPPGTPWPTRPRPRRWRAPPGSPSPRGGPS